MALRRRHRISIEHLIIKRRHHIVDIGHGVQFWTESWIRIIPGSKELILPGPCILRDH
jgi:hypothetical protein